VKRSQATYWLAPSESSVLVFLRSSATSLFGAARTSSLLFAMAAAQRLSKMAGLIHLVLCLPLVAGLPQYRQTMVVSGTRSKFLDGRYLGSETPSSYNGEEKCYQKDDATKSLLCMGPGGYWMVEPPDQRGAATGRGYLISHRNDMEAPQMAGPWYIWVDGHWVEEDRIKVEPDSVATTTTVAMMILGSLLVISVVCWMAISRVASMRELIYTMLSKMFTIFVGYMFSDGLYDFLCHEETGTIGRNIGVRITIGFLFFVLCYFSLLVVMWKVQYNAKRCGGVRTLGSCLTAFFGIFTVTVVQEEVATAFPNQVEGAGLGSHEGKLLGAVLVLFFTWLLLAVFRHATIGLRMDRFGQAPTKPWSKKKTIVIPSPTKRTCANPFATEVQQITVVHEWDGWQDQFEWAEDTIAVLILSYLVNQTIYYINTGLFPKLIDRRPVLSTNLGTVWTAELVILAVSTFAVIRMRAAWQDSSRSGRSAQYVCAVSASWCLYRLLHHLSFEVFPDCAALADVSCAFVVSIVSVIIAGIVANQWKNVQNQAFWSNLVFGCTICCGNIIGLSWGAVAEDSLDTYEVLVDVNQQTWSIVKLALSWGAGLATAIIWYRVILPRSEMAANGNHEALIQAEEKLLLIPE